MRVEEMSDFFPQKPFSKQKKSFFRISQDHVRAMIAEVVPDGVQKNFYKIYFFE